MHTRAAFTVKNSANNARSCGVLLSRAVEENTLYLRKSARISVFSAATALAPVKHGNMNHVESVLFILLIALNMLISLLSFWRAVIWADIITRCRTVFVLAKGETYVRGSITPMMEAE